MQLHVYHIGEKSVLWALALGLIFLIPASPQMRPLALPVGSFFITAVEIIIFVYVGLWIVSSLIRKKEQSKRVLFRRYILAMLAFYSLHVLVGIFKRSPVQVLGDFRQYLPIIMYFPIVYVFRTEESLAYLRKVIFSVLLLTAIYVCFLFLFCTDFMIHSAIEAGNKILINRIFFANTLFLLFSYLSYLVTSCFDPTVPLETKVFYGIILIVNATMLLFMQARSLWSIFAIIILLSVFSLGRFRQKLLYVLVVGYLIVFAFSVAYLSFNVFNYRPSVIKRIETSIVDRARSFFDIPKIGTRKRKISRSIGTVETRIETAKRVTKDYIIPNWLWGIGLGGQIPMVSPNGEVIKWKYQIDNGYLTILAKYGLVGFLLYAAFVIKVLLTLIKLIKSNRLTSHDAMLAKSFLIAILAMIVGSVFSSIFVRHQTSIVAFTLMLCEIERMNSKCHS